MSTIDPYELERLMKRFFECLDEVKLVKTTRTTVIQLSSTSNPTGTETVVEYTIKRK